MYIINYKKYQYTKNKIPIQLLIEIISEEGEVVVKVRSNILKIMCNILDGEPREYILFYFILCGI